MAKARNEVLQEDRWNVEALYLNSDAWKESWQQAIGSQKAPHWPALAAYRGRLKEGAETLKAFLEQFFTTSRQLTSLYTYAHLKHDEELTDDLYKNSYNQISVLLHEFNSESAWIEPELLSLSEATVQAYLSDPLLAPYRFHLEKLLRLKPHVLPPEQELLMAMTGNALQTAHKAFSAINDADFKFGEVLDSKGNLRELTHGSYGMYLRDQDRTLRENAFKQMHSMYATYENTLCELLNGQVQAHIFNARARHYQSSLEAALFPKNIDLSVYHSLIQTVHEEIPTLHRYVQLREKVLGVGPLHLYDMSVPLTPNVDFKMSYGEAEEIVIESVAPLGKEYQMILKKGFKEQRWVDRYENQNKRSGAYSSGCYDSMPYILMNYKGILRDVFTLAHEAGHSMHSQLTHTHQPYQYGDYPIFLAEVASIFNEDLLSRLMLHRAKSKEEKIFLLTQQIEDIRGTFFRQTMFAEFELLIHEIAEKGVPLTPKQLKEEFLRLNLFYFGPHIVIDLEIAIEWARIPHFYYNFYVFQYATGMSAAMALAERVLKGGAVERESYLTFLKGGSSRYPLEMLQLAGVDMRTAQPVKATTAKFAALLQQLEELLF
jgi:oligoendopeptidase F